jgi:hypothetical protein
MSVEDGLLPNKIDRAKKRLARWRNEKPGAHRAAYIEHCVQKAERWLKHLLQEEKQMLRHEDTPTSVNAPGPGWKLVCNRALQIGSRQCRRGEEIDPNVLAATANGAHLLQHGHLRWVPGGDAPAPKPAAPKPPVVDIKPVDHIDVARKELRRIADTRKVSLRDAIDLVDSSVMNRARKEYADNPPNGQVFEGALGSPATWTPSGTKAGNTARRSVAGFEDHLISGAA